MNRCSDECYPICDFCTHYKPDEPFGGDGVCLKDGQRRSCDEWCDDFHCDTLAEDEKKRADAEAALSVVTAELTQLWTTEG
jgi:hypothetical protein